MQLTASQKLQICQKKQSDPKISHKQLETWAKKELKLSKEPSTSAIGRILADKEKSGKAVQRNGDSKKAIQGKWLILEEALHDWFVQVWLSTDYRENCSFLYTLR